MTPEERYQDAIIAELKRIHPLRATAGGLLALTDLDAEMPQGAYEWMAALSGLLADGRIVAHYGGNTPDTADLYFGLASGTGDRR